MSQHLAKLRFSGLVTTTRQSRHMIYSIPDGHLVRLVLEGLNYADHQVTGEAPHD
ncbi:ArsR/SmtB family transcription factor [Arthrobacter pigmenti]